MRILFISSGNKNRGISPIVQNQKESLIETGLIVDSYPIMGKGILGYLKNIRSLRQYKRFHHFDLFHAHYSLSAFVVSLSGCTPLVVSLMGSDTKPDPASKFLIRLFNSIFWSTCIVKSEQMRNDIKLRKALIIPNGVNFTRVFPISKSEAQKRLYFSPGKKHILFASDPDRPEKNYALADQAIRLIKNYDIEVHFLKNIVNSKVGLHYCASDIVLLTSTREGSPNVIKEAMACNRPIVCTNVGDVAEIIGSTENCFVCSFNKNEIAAKIDYILSNNIKETNGRKNIYYLADDKIAKKIIQVYESILRK